MHIILLVEIRLRREAQELIDTASLLPSIAVLRQAQQLCLQLNSVHLYLETFRGIIGYFQGMIIEFLRINN